jgi:hypothetical protein
MLPASVIQVATTPRQIDRDAVADILQQHHTVFDRSSEPHVVLRASTPWVQDLGYLNFIGNWHYWAEPPGDHADWVRAIAPTSAGRLEVWMLNVTPGAQYLLIVDVSCSEGGDHPAFRIGASDGAHSLVSATPPDQQLLVLFEPKQNMSLVFVEPNDLDSWTFHSAEVFILFS